MTIRQKNQARLRETQSGPGNQPRPIRTVDIRHRLAGTLVAAFAALLVTPAFADGYRFGDTLTLSVGGMNHTGDGYVTSTRPNLPLDRVTFTDLDLNDDADIVWANLNWQFANRWQLALSFSNFDSQGLKVASTDGNFDGIEWQVGAVLASRLDVDFFIFDLSYDLLQKEHGRLGVGFGLHTADLEFDLLVGVFGSVGGGEVEFVPIAIEESSVLAPLPNFSLVGGYQVAESLYLEGRAGWFSLTYDDYKGDLMSLRFSAEWRPWQRVGVGVAYQFVDVDVDRDGSRGRDTFDLKFDGPVLFISAGF